MPYIHRFDREVLDNKIDELMAELDGVGDDDIIAGRLNYIISSLAWRLCGHNEQGERRYARMNTVLGAMEAAKLEFYRRIVVPYENEKIQENGDV